MKRLAIVGHARHAHQRRRQWQAKYSHQLTRRPTAWPKRRPFATSLEFLQWRKQRQTVASIVDVRRSLLSNQHLCLHQRAAHNGNAKEDSAQVPLQMGESKTKGRRSGHAEILKTLSAGFQIYLACSYVWEPSFTTEARCCVLCAHPGTTILVPVCTQEAR